MKEIDIESESMEIKTNEKINLEGTEEKLQIQKLKDLE